MDRIPKSPSGLRPEAKRYWKIVNDGWELDDDALEILRNACFALSREYEAKAIVDEAGLIYKCGDSLRQNPAFRIEKESREQFLRAVKQLDLEPAKEKRPPGRPPEGY